MIGIGVVVKVAGTIISGAVALADGVKAIKPVAELVDKKIDKRNELIELPEIPDRNTLMTVDMAEILVRDKGLSVFRHEIKPNRKYRNYVENEVVKMNRRSRQKVKPGTQIIVYYVTDRIIEESKKLQDVYLKQKAENKKKRNATREKVLDKAPIVMNTLGKIK